MCLCGRCRHNSKNAKSTKGNFYNTKEAEKLGLIINTNKTKYRQVTRKTNIIIQDIEVEGKSYEIVNQFICLGSQINSKNLIKEEIRLRIQAGNRSLFVNKKLLKNKDLNAASKLQIYKSIVRCGCETRAMTVTEQNRLLIFESRLLRKIFGPTQDNDGTWRIKTNEELEILIKKETIVRFIKSQRLRRAAYVTRMDTIRTVDKTNWMGTMFIKTSRKTKTEMARTGRRRLKEDESEKLEREV